MVDMIGNLEPTLLTIASKASKRTSTLGITRWGEVEKKRGRPTFFSYQLSNPHAQRTDMNAADALFTLSSSSPILISGLY